MINSFFLTKQLEMHPRRLIRRLIGFALAVFTLFLFAAYLILHNSSRNNLDAFYSNIKMHSQEFIQQQINERKNNLAILAALPQYREIMKIVERYIINRQAHNGLFSPEEFLSTERKLKPLMNFREIFNEHQSLLNSLHMVEFISMDGFSISGDFPDFKYEPFPYFYQLKTAVARGETAGNFLVMKSNPPGVSSGFEKGIIYFFQQVKGDEGLPMGYFCLQLNLDMVVDILTSRLPGQEFLHLASDGNNDGFYTIYRDIELYWINKEGKPLTSLRHNSVYTRNLSSVGFQGGTAYPLFDPLRPKAEDEVSNIPVITSLLNNYFDELMQLKNSYFSYYHEKVNGGGFWVDEINCGLVAEIESDRVFRPYRSAFFLICVILLLSLFVTLYFILLINKLRETALDANPLTQLPGNRVINERIQFFLNKGYGAVVYGDLDNFKAYNDAYGFSLGDRVIQFTADILKNHVGIFPVKKSFCGHIGGDDFIFIVPEGDVLAVTAEIGEKFDKGIRDFYNNVHLEKGFIEGKNREGAAVKYPVMAFSMAGVLLSRHHMKHYLEVANHCGELKKFSKKIHGSKLFMDRREDKPGIV